MITVKSLRKLKEELEQLDLEDLEIDDIESEGPYVAS